MKLPRPEWAGSDKPFIRLSHSTLELVNSCERKFQIEKLLAGQVDREESAHLSFGHAFGTFGATYMQTGSYEIALLDGWLAYWPILEIEEKKTQELFMELADQCRPALDELREEWEVAEFDGVPAIELSFRIDIDDTFYYVGYLDLVLKHKKQALWAVLDFKTTGLQLIDIKPLYKFSGQGLGYSLVLDSLVGREQSSSKVIYFVGRLGRNPWLSTRPEVHEFSKGLADRLRWYMELKQDVQKLHTCIELFNFPRRSSSCIRFNKACRHFETCSLTVGDKYRKFEEDKIEYQFRYSLDELIAMHMSMVGA